ncbi:hypothetical protein [Pontiella sp.]|uniref:hypothetical protein n=1 Tax=Pontiella sp. TaxID=2837462 RepID=UPI00356AF5AA
MRIEIDTQVYADMPNSKNPHGYMGFRIYGDSITFVGGEFEDIGEQVGPRGANEFVIDANDFTMKDCSVTIRGSSPFGYGDLYGKGRGAVARLKKHALMSVMGDRILVENCAFKVFSYGHGIHLHGAQDAVFRKVNMLGMLRRTDEIYAETSGLAKEHDYKMMFPDWKQGQPIPKGEMLSLTEDGIRAYVRGVNKDGEERATGYVTLENCTLTRMRSCIALTAASSATVTDCTVREAGGTAYGLPSDCTVRNCKGDAAFSPLLSIPYSNRRNADIELELMGHPNEMGDHPLATLVGSGHTITISYEGRNPKQLRPIMIGSTGERYTEDNSDASELRSKNAASGITLINQTPHPVELTEFASSNKVKSRGAITDHGVDNTVRKVR